MSVTAGLPRPVPRRYSRLATDRRTTSFAVSDLKVEGGKTLNVSFALRNTGNQTGAHMPQVYLPSAAGKSVLRLIGLDKVQLASGEQKRISVVADPRLLASFDSKAAWLAHRGWRLPDQRERRCGRRRRGGNCERGGANAQALTGQGQAASA